MNSDHNVWNIVLNGNSRKKTGRDPKGNIMILPLVSGEEHIAVQRETKGRTILLQWPSLLKTKGGLEYLSFDDLYNKLRTLELNVKGGSSYDSRGTSALTHSVFISAASTNSKMSYDDSQNQSPSITFTTASSSVDTSSNVIESVLHSFTSNGKWQCFRIINRFEKKAGKKMKFNNKDAAREQLDSKARYSAFKLKELDKSKEPKALLSIDSMLNWSDHEGEDEEKGDAQVYGMIAGDDDEATCVCSGDVSDASWLDLLVLGQSSQEHFQSIQFNKLTLMIHSDNSSDSRPLALPIRVSKCQVHQAQDQ
ncbi:hypothetical protein Tco_1371188 [Tanacetum coccineum]